MSRQKGPPRYIPSVLNGNPERPVESRLERKSTASNFVINKLVTTTGAFFCLVVTFTLLLISAAGFTVSKYFLILMVIFLDLFLAVAGVSIWRLGIHFRGLSRRFWQKHTDPDRFSEEQPLHHFIAPRIPKSTLRSYNVGFRYRFVMGFKQCFLAISLLGIIGFAFIAFAQVGSFPNGEIHTSNSISVLTGFISALLGPLFGVLTLGLVTIVQRPEDLALLVVFIIIPSLYFAPAAHNFILAAESLLRGDIFRLSEYLPSGWLSHILVTFLFFIANVVLVGLIAIIIQNSLF